MAFRSPKNNQPQPAQPENGSVPVEPKKKKKWPWILAALLLLLIIIVSCTPKGGDTSPTSNDSSSAATSPEASETKQAEQPTGSAETTQAGDTQSVELRATSSGNGNVMYGAGGSTNTEQFNTEWTKTVNGVKKSDGYMLTVTGDVMDQNSKVSCQILVDGKVEKEATGSGSGGGASCLLDAKFW